MKNVLLIFLLIFSRSIWLPAQLIIYEPFDYPLGIVNPVIHGTLPVTDDLFVPHLLSPVNISYSSDYNVDCHYANSGSQFTSAVTDSLGNIYAVFIDPDLNLKVLKKTISGTISQNIVRTGVTNNPFHVKPSIVIDKKGFIHIAGDMHNQPWVYYRSLSPLSISAFDQLSNLPGHLITYPQFFKDANEDLYVTFRHKVKTFPYEWTAGSSAGGIIRYDAVSKTFTMLGGESHGFLKTVVWSQYGGLDGHYQQPGLRLFFDISNRMHLIATMIGETGHSTVSWKATHLLYAYSDDGGDTFYNLAGQLLTLPMSQDNMTVVSYIASANIWSNAFVGALSHNRPVIGWRDDTGYYLVKWTGDQWMNLLPETGASGMVNMRRNGDIALLRTYQGIYYSNDGGKTYRMYTFNPGLSSLSPTDEIADRDYFIKTGKFRFQFMTNSGTSVKGITIDWIQ